MKRAAVLLSISLSFLATACGGGAAGTSEAPGTWTADEGKTSLELKADNTFAMDTKKNQHITGTWKLEGEKLTLTGGPDSMGSFSGTLKADEISLAFGPTTTVFRRK